MNSLRTPRASISVSLPGIDLVFEGEVERVTDRPTLEALVPKFNAERLARAPSRATPSPRHSAPRVLGHRPGTLYRFRFDKVIGVATAEPYGATRWRFA